MGIGSHATVPPSSAASTGWRRPTIPEQQRPRIRVDAPGAVDQRVLIGE